MELIGNWQIYTHPFSEHRHYKLLYNALYVFKFLKIHVHNMVSKVKDNIISKRTHLGFEKCSMCDIYETQKVKHQCQKLIMNIYFTYLLIVLIEVFRLILIMLI